MKKRSNAVKMQSKQTHIGRQPAAASQPYQRVVDALSRDRRVNQGEGKGFGSGALKVSGRIFAMMTPKGQFVVKLAKQRVDELVSAGDGERFDPGRGRPGSDYAPYRPSSG